MFIKSIDTHKFKHSTHTHTNTPKKKKIRQFNWKLPKLKTSNNKKKTTTIQIMNLINKTMRMYTMFDK